MLKFCQAPNSASYCAAILASIRKGAEAGGHTLDVIHLDEDGFDPVMRSEELRAFALARSDPAGARALLDPQVLAYRERLLAAEHVVFVFPIWWELMPALMKGFIDKVIFPGVAYGYGGKSRSGMVSQLDNLRGMTVITTMNTPAWAYRFIFGNAIQKALLRGTFWKIGIRKSTWISLTKVKTRSPQERAGWLEMIHDRMRDL